MSKVDSLGTGWKYCNCHPETCSHFDGKVWVGETPEFEIDWENVKELNSDINYITAEQAMELIVDAGFEASVSKENPKLEEHSELYISIPDEVKERISRKYKFIRRNEISWRVNDYSWKNMHYKYSILWVTRLIVELRKHKRNELMETYLDY